MPDVTLTLAAEDQASGILDRIVNSLESLNSAVADQTGVYSEFQQQVLRRQEAANQAVQDRVENEKKVYNSIKEILDRTEKLYKQHADAVAGINRGVTQQGDAHDEKTKYQQQVTADTMRIKQLDDTIKREADIRKSDSDAQKESIDTNKHARRMAYQQQVTSDKTSIKQLDDTVKKESDIRKSDSDAQKESIDTNKHARQMAYQNRMTSDKTNIKQLENTVKRESDIRKSELESQKDQNDANKHARKMAYQEQSTSDSAKLKELGVTTSKESDLKKGAQASQEHLITAEGHARRMEYQQQVNADEKSLKQLNNTIKEEDTKRRRSFENRKNTIDKNKYERKVEYQEQVSSDQVMLKQLDDTIKAEDTKRKRGLENRKNAIDREKHNRKSAYQEQVTTDKKSVKQLDNTVKAEDNIRKRGLEDLKNVSDKQKHERRESYHDRVQAGKLEVERLRQQHKKEMHLIRQEEREKDRIMRGGRRGRGGIGGASQVFTGILAADLFGVGIREIYDWSKAILDATIKYQGMVFGLKAVEGSAEKAAVQLDRIIEIAKLPGIQLEPAIKATVTLRALKLEGELVERTIKAVGNALATLGREGELGGVVLALSQIIGKGKIHAEEINQIAERLPLIRGILVEEFGTANTEVLQKMELEIEDFVERITQGLEKLPKVATQIGTSFKNLGNQMFLLTTQIGTFWKDEITSAIDWITKHLENLNLTLKDYNKYRDEIRQRNQIAEESVEITTEVNVALGKSTELEKMQNSLSNIETRLEPRRADESGMDLFNRQRGITPESNIVEFFSGLLKGPDTQGLQEKLDELTDTVSDLNKQQRESMKSFRAMDYDTLNKKMQTLGRRLEFITRLSDPEYRKQQKQVELEALKETRPPLSGIKGPAGYLAISKYEDQLMEIHERFTVTPEEQSQMDKEMKGLRDTITFIATLTPKAIREGLLKRATQSTRAGEVAALELEIYNEKIAKLVASEIVPELDPSLEQKIKRVAESADVAVGIEAKVLGLQEQFNAAVDVGLDGLLRNVDKQFEQDMRKIANNIKPIAEKLKPEIAALKTRAEREVAQDEVLADIRKKYETVAELHKKIITEYYNSMVELEVTFKRWLRDATEGPQIPAQQLTRIDKLVESQMIQDAIGLQMEGLAEPFSRVREYALETLTRTIQGDTEKQLLKLREDVIKIAKATHPDLHTYTPERQTDIFSDLFEQRAPAIYASEKALLHITEERFNSVLNLHLEFQTWYEDKFGADAISSDLDALITKITGRSEFDEAIRFRVEGFEKEFQYERKDMIQTVGQKLQTDLIKSLKDIAGQVEGSLVSHEYYLKMSPQEQSAEFDRVFNQLSAPVMHSIGPAMQDAIKHIDKVVETRTTINKWIRDNFQQPFLSEQQLSVIRRTIGGKDFQYAIELEIGGMTNQFKNVKEYVLGNLIDSINQDAEEKIRKAAVDIEGIILADPANLNKSKMELIDAIEEAHQKRVDVIVAGRDLAIQQLKDEFERLSQIHTHLKRSASKRLVEDLGQTKLRRLVTEDVQKAIESSEMQKAFQQRVGGTISPQEFQGVMDKGLDELIKRYQRDTAVALEKMYEEGPRILAPRIAQTDSAIEQERIEREHYTTQESLIRGRETQRVNIARGIYSGETGRESAEQREDALIRDVKQLTTSQRFDRIDFNKDFRDKETQKQQQIEDSALSAANNVISAWQQVSQQTDTMVDDVVGAVATIALQVTEMLLTIQRTSAASTAAGQTTGLLGQFATGLGVAGIALGAAATVYSLVDQQNDSRGSRNSIQRGRPKSISRR